MSRAAIGAWAVVWLVLLPGCSALGPETTVEARQRIQALPATDVVLLGEQHDAPEHQQLEHAFVLELAARERLGALAIEMAEQGRSTAGLSRDAAESEVRSALQWNDAGWPWADYGPVVMAAVRSGVPVLGANLARDAMRTQMTNTSLDAHLPPLALARQHENIRTGHCMLLPESQIAPMTRIQIARDKAMAQTVVGAMRPGRTVLLVAGGGHVVRDVGVPTHLPRTLSSTVVLAVAGEGDPAMRAGADVVWHTPAVASRDHCADLKQRIRP